ncbi:TonB-dependent receptor [Roseateles sp. LKC17W]|uniref:TonB-dependent receptor n=1 Tax=Pelomonas margarita TaxID=3299031 RepID=A0ABW7FGT0_9BURK
MKHHQTLKSRRSAARVRLNPVALASTLALLGGAGAVQAQQATAAAGTQSLETVVVTGIRKSLDSAVTLKRESRGLVDGIVAEDIGKFPDTNLAESMQRIAGVSIDRSASGEGSQVTVRGVGPDFNMVLLNGRQMPTAVIGWENQGANGSRAFDFANLSADSISALEVYKTARAESPTGGIGATINVKTARPLDVRERIASIGVKANYDASTGRLPGPLQGDKLTPEISGIYSDTFGNRTLGIAISGSYSKRDSGSNKAYTQNGWGTNDPAVKAVSPTGNIVNQPAGLYATSRELRYSLTGMERERLNGQVTLQFAPTKDLKFTVDHTIAVNTLSSKNAEMSSWFNNSFSGNLKTSPATKFTSGAVAAPIVQTAIWDGTHDLALNVGEYAQKSKLNSTGFNAAWKLSDALSVDLDAHSSKSKTTPDSPFGTYVAFAVPMFNQGNATAYYDKDLPILGLPGQVFDATKLNVSGTQFRNNLSDQTIDQAQARTTYRIDADNKLVAGLGFTKTKNRSASYNNQNNDWSGVAPTLGQFANIASGTYNLSSFFNRIPGHDDPRLTPNFYTVDFLSARARAIQVKMANTPGMTQAQAEAYFSAATDYTKGDDWRATEKSSSIYGQWDHAFDTAVPMNISVGLRYETTKVEASSQVVNRAGTTTWGSQNEINLPSGSTSFGTKTGKYSYVLPSIDWDADLADNLKVRASYGENIGRPGWNQMQGGLSLGGTANPNGGGTGSTGDPALKPLKSKNLDLSAEYYYAKSSYVAAGVFYKQVSNFVTTAVVSQTVAGINNPASGTAYTTALAACTATGTQPLCIRNYIFRNFNGQPGVTATGPLTAAEVAGNITSAVAGATPIAFQVTTFRNGPSDKIKGLELNFQHMFGNSGFGVSGNVTKVSTGLKFNNLRTDQQTALLGVSDSANLVGFFENEVWSIRGAYNWRGEFLAKIGDGNGDNPVYTEAYGQLDASLGYKLGKNLTLQLDLLNLNDGYIRQHGRTNEMLVSAIQTGRRYLIGARYRF